MVGTPRPSAVQRALGWSTIVDLETEDGRAFIQDRIAFLGKVAFLLSILSFALTRLAVALDPAAAAPLEARRGSDLMAAAAYAYYLLMWLVCRRGRRARGMLGLLDGAFPIVSTAAASLPLILWPGEIPGLEWRVLLILTHTQVGRAVFVPSPPLRTLVIGMVAAAPAAAGIWIDQASRGAPAGPAFAIPLITWALISIAMAGVTSGVIYGLRRKVHEARQLGQYTLQEKLGEGGMGIVYRAQHAMLRRPTAIKLLPPEKAGDHNLQRFEREVQLTSLLTHPNTVSVFDYGRTPDGVFYYAMEYLDGINLDALVKGFGPQEPARVVHILRQVAGSLAEAHGVGLVHRDIKPANVILCQRGGLPDVAKVVDFGLAKDLEGASSSALTRATDITGTPLYLAPEAITAPDRVDARGDLYALGAVGYYLLAGVHVFEGATLVELCSHHLRTPPVAPSTRLGRPLPADLEAVVLSCLEKDPARRPQSADALASHLAMCVGVDEWKEAQAREWWARHAERIAALRVGLRPAGGPGRTLSMDVSSRAGWGD
jgi:serine/threonine-protein kinase